MAVSIIDIQRALTPGADREEAILGMPEDRKVKANFGRDVLLDVSTPEKEYKHMMFPVNCVFNWDEWQLRVHRPLDGSR